VKHNAAIWTRQEHKKDVDRQDGGKGFGPYIEEQFLGKPALSINIIRTPFLGGND
jgi:hypothetical protein